VTDGVSGNEAAQPARRLGYWATAAWAVVAFLVGQFVALAVVVWWRVGRISAVLDTPYDGELVTLFILIANPITIALLALAARLARLNPADYLGLKWPKPREAMTDVAWLLCLIALGDALLYASGRELVTSFQVQSYTSAAAEGWLPALLIAAIIVAPAGEEIVFRGFLFRGLVNPERSAWPAIIAISMLWAALHIQYDWAGVLQIFVIGLFLGWVRLRSGSTLLTFVLHALFNLEGSMETVLYVKFFS
jgi:membrane protease YdiL (CAAX protease family)